MNLKKFISGVSAFAIAASAFAAMAVTASAEEKSESIDVKTQTTFTRMSSYGSGVATASTWSGNNYALVKRDFSDFEGIDEATSVTLSFDTYVYASTVTYYGIGDGAGRTSYFNSNGTYRTSGLAMFFGSTGSAYGAYNVKAGSYAFTDNSLGATRVTASFTFDKDAGTITYDIGGHTGTIATDISNLTYIEAVTTKSGGKFGLDNITVSYTVPDEEPPAPVVPVVSSSVVAAEAFTTPDYDEDVVVGVIELNVSEAAIDLADATYQGQPATVDGETSFIGTALINVIISGATSTDALADVVFN